MYPIKSYTEAKSIKEAIELLEINQNAMLIAGGTDILIKARELKSGYVDRDLVGITRIKELKNIELNQNGDIIIGSAVTFFDIEKNLIIQEKFSILAQAVGSIGGPQIRNMGTLGGNLCNGAVSADSASALIAAEAVMVVQSKNTVREVNATDFYLRPGVVDVGQNEILTHVKIKKSSYENFKGCYIKFAPRKAMDIATIGCAVLLKESNLKVIDLRVAFGVAGPTPIRAKKAESFAKDKILNEAMIEQICSLCTQDTKARDSWRASKLFRENLITELPKKALKEIVGDKNA